MFHLFCGYRLWYTSCYLPQLQFGNFHISTFRSLCAVPSMAVLCSSLMSWFPGMQFRYFLSDFFNFSIFPYYSGITFVYTSHIHCIYAAVYLYLKIFTASFFNTFLYPGTAASINKHVPFPLSRIMMSGLLSRMILSVFNC